VSAFNVNRGRKKKSLVFCFAYFLLGFAYFLLCCCRSSQHGTPASPFSFCIVSLPLTSKLIAAKTFETNGVFSSLFCPCFYFLRRASGFSLSWCDRNLLSFGLVCFAVILFVLQGAGREGSNCGVKE